MECWYDKNLHKSVNAFTKKEPLLDQVNHGVVLKELFSLIPNGANTVIDLGCGNAKTSTVVGSRSYTGVDLPNNIKTIGKVNYPNLEFISCNILVDDISFIRKYNIILMNALIDVMEHPLAILESILRHYNPYVLIHCQEVIDAKTHVTKNPSYTGFTYHSLVNRKSLVSLFHQYHFEVLKEVDAGFGGNWRSFLLCKR